MTRADLIARVEAAEKNDVALFRDAAIATYHDRLMPMEDGRRWIERFDALLNAGAYLDAAMMMVPEGWLLIHLGERQIQDAPPFEACLSERDAEFGRAKVAYRYAATPALALVAACLRAGGE